ncbi:unnamed protein product [Sphagnum jensenii]|uniref:Uncharacterized protein n=1 Tax=Sphagnum jensenii TaxID=128206 RepID=A0ABP1BBB0_9BRYO
MRLAISVNGTNSWRTPSSRMMSCCKSSRRRFKRSEQKEEELRRTTESLSGLQQTVQDLRDDILIVEEDFQILVTENERLRGKAELADLWHHRIEAFKTLKMEHAFMKTKLFIYQQNACRVRVDQCSTSPRLPN